MTCSFEVVLQASRFVRDGCHVGDIEVNDEGDVHYSTSLQGVPQAERPESCGASFFSATGSSDGTPIALSMASRRLRLDSLVQMSLTWWTQLP